jgi:hypothetical protein
VGHIADHVGQASPRLLLSPGLARELCIDFPIGVVCILPLLLTAHPPLADLPSHLARQYIIRDWASSPYLQTFYSIHWALIPNLALERFVLVARQVMSIDMAVRMFCIVTVFLLFVGTSWVNHLLSFGQSRLYRVVPLLCYGGPFQYGFLSYCFGVGLGMVLFGLYLRCCTQTLGRLALWLMPLSFTLLLCHLVAFGLFALAVGSSELAYGFTAAGGWTGRLPLELLKRQLRPICCLLPMLLGFLWLSPPSEHSGPENAILFATLRQTARSFASIILFASPGPEVALLATAVLGLGAALVTRTVHLRGVGLTVVTVLLIAWLLMPQAALGATFINYLMPWAISLFPAGWPNPRPGL